MANYYILRIKRYKIIKIFELAIKRYKLYEFTNYDFHAKIFPNY